MRNLVRRYVTVQQRRAESQGVTEDDVNEIKQDISAFRCELVEILKNSGMNTSTASGGPGGAGGKKNRQKERRLMKGFNVAPSIASTSLTPVNENSGGFPLDGSQELSALSGLFGPGITPRKQGQPNPLQQQLSTSQSSVGDSMNPIHKSLSRFAPKFHSKRNSGSHKRKWGNLRRFIAFYDFCVSTVSLYKNCQNWNKKKILNLVEDTKNESRKFILRFFSMCKMETWNLF